MLRFSSVNTTWPRMGCLGPQSIPELSEINASNFSVVKHQLWRSFAGPGGVCTALIAQHLQLLQDAQLLPAQPELPQVPVARPMLPPKCRAKNRSAAGRETLSPSLHPTALPRSCRAHRGPQRGAWGWGMFYLLIFRDWRNRHNHPPARHGSLSASW